MYSTVQEYYRFLEKQKEEKKDFLEKTSVVVNAQMDAVMSSHGWYPKGKGFYTKQFNGKAITVVLTKTDLVMVVYQSLSTTSLSLTP